MMSFQTETKEPITINFSLENITSKMQAPLLKDFSMNMDQRAKRNNNSSANTTQIPSKITTLFLAWIKMPQWIKLKKLTEDSLFNTILKTILETRRRAKNLLL